MRHPRSTTMRHLKREGPAALTFMAGRYYPFVRLHRRHQRAACAAEAALLAAGPATVPFEAHLVHTRPGIDGRDLPLGGVEAELWEPRAVGPDRLLARGTVGADGRLALRLHPREVKAWELRFNQVLARTDLAVGGAVERRPVVVVPVSPTWDGAGWSVDRLEVPWWEYAEGAGPPRAALVAGGAPPDPFRPGRREAGFAAVHTQAAVRLAYLVQDALGPRPATVDAIQAAYPPNRSRALDLSTPGISRSDGYLVDRVLNGFNPCHFRRHPSGLWTVDFTWSHLPQRPSHFAPDVRGWFRAEASGPILDHVTVRRAGPHPGETGPEEHVWPTEGARWEAARRLFRTGYGLHGELVAHLALSHLNMEQYAIPAFRHLHHNPVARLLHPHLRETAMINHWASSLLLGDDGFLVEGSALTREATEQVITEALATCDWAGWSPRAPVCETHRFARVGRLYWELVGEVVEGFFRAHAAEIVAHWGEVRRFSDELVHHSLGRPGADTGDPRVDPHEVHRDERFVRDPGGRRRAVSAITDDAIPQALGLDNLAQVCRYVIHTATFYHTWANDEQYPDAGDVRYSSLGLDVDLLAQPDAVGLSPYEASTQLFLSWFLTETRYGTLTGNEDGDVYPELIRGLQMRRPQFQAMGYDIDRIRSRINI